MKAEREARLGALEERLGHRFRDAGLLEWALTHSSRAREELGSPARHNEPLEFLGDAVLGFLVADLLHRRDPAGAEGAKTRARAALVSTPSLARHAQALGLGDLLRLGRGEEKTGGRGKTALLSDAYEAVIAALYLDGGIEAARGFVERDFAKDLERGRALSASDWKSALQELLQGRGQPLPEYAVPAEAGTPNRQLWHVECRIAGGIVGHGQGQTKKAAQQEAAREALAHLRDDELEADIRAGRPLGEPWSEVRKRLK